MNARKLFDIQYNQFMCEQEKHGSQIAKRLFNSGPPLFQYQPLDLFLLWTIVQELGGYSQIESWSVVVNALVGRNNLFATDAAFRIRRNYEKYLLAYELHIQNRQEAAEALAEFWQPRHFLPTVAL